MTIAQEEIFGPVLSIIPYDTEEEAIEIANDTVYGLAGGVWSGDKEHAERVARRLRTGQVDVNGGGFNPLRAVRRLQAVGHRPRARQVRPRGVPRDQVDAALTRRRPRHARRKRVVVVVGLHAASLLPPSSTSCCPRRRPACPNGAPEAACGRAGGRATATTTRPPTTTTPPPTRGPCPRPRDSGVGDAPVQRRDGRTVAGHRDRLA